MNQWCIWENEANDKQGNQLIWLRQSLVGGYTISCPFINRRTTYVNLRKMLVNNILGFEFSFQVFLHS